MYFNHLKLALPALCLFLSLAAACQSGLTSTGGVATGDNGSVTYSVGLVSYAYLQDDDFLFSQGLQHAYEISPVGITKELYSPFNLSAFPNPTLGNVSLVSEKPISGSLKLELLSENGQLILREDINSQRTEISLSSLAAGVYIIQVYDGENAIQSFKIIKNS